MRQHPSLHGKTTWAYTPCVICLCVNFVLLSRKVSVI